MSSISQDVYLERLGAGTYAKVAWRLIPFLFFCYMCAYLDRINVSFAKLQMLQELGMSDAVYGLGAGIFFVGYLMFEVPSNLILLKVGARRWIARIMVTWGVVSAAMMFVSTPTQFYVVRFLLGVAEAGFFPAILLYLTYWFPAGRRSKVTALFMTGIPMSGVLGGPLSGWIMHAMSGAHGLAGWQWLFLIEGLPAVLLGVVVLFYLTDAPHEARWLEPEEREWLAATIRAEQSVAERHAIGLGRALLHPTVWLLCLILFACQAGSYGLQFWVPQIIQGMAGFTNLQIGLISAIPYAAASIGMIWIGASSDRSGERLLHLAIPTAVAAVGFVVSAFYTTPVPGMLALTIAAVGVISTRGPFWALPTRFLTGKAAAGGIALINLFAAISGFVGPYAVGYLVKVTGSYAAGMLFLAALMVLGALLCIPLRGAKVFADEPAARPADAHAGA